MRKLPTAVDDFKKIIDGGYYYVDKSMLIAKILESASDVLMFQRPRRFGKTVNLTMLFYYFDIGRAEENRRLFRDLKIAQSEYFLEQGCYPVIYLSFKDIRSKDFAECKTNIYKAFLHLLDHFSFIYDKLSQGSRFIYDDLMRSKDSIFLVNAIFYLSKFLYEFYGKPVIILVDEYDAPVIDSWHKDYYRDIGDFWRTLFSSGLKGNPYMKFSVLTGLFRLTRDDLYAKMLNSIIDTPYEGTVTRGENFFSFNEGEVVQILKEYGLSHMMESVRKWYGGYQYGNEEVYNPWSVIMFAKQREFRTYWINPVNIDAITQLLGLMEDYDFRDLATLLQNESIRKYIFRSLPFPLVISDKKIWTFLLDIGYLTLKRDSVEEGCGYLRIPNREVYTFFRCSFIEKFVGLSSPHFEELLSSVRGGVITGQNSFEENLQAIVHAKSRELAPGNSDIFCYGFTFSLAMALQREYAFYVNIVEKIGKIELLLRPKDKNQEGYALALKSLRDGESHDEALAEAHEAMDKSGYKALFAESGISRVTAVAVTLYGDAFRIRQKGF
ncbi:MAG: AAA family ATPase [Fusobacteriaceae bacterium]|jgi:hypothetical protein|nr:AAA family ATPase [Fusobacteriaceae bacterium]